MSTVLNSQSRDPNRYHRFDGYFYDYAVTYFYAACTFAVGVIFNGVTSFNALATFTAGVLANSLNTDTIHAYTSTDTAFNLWTTQSGSSTVTVGNNSGTGNINLSSVTIGGSSATPSLNCSGTTLTLFSTPTTLTLGSSAATIGIGASSGVCTINNTTFTLANATSITCGPALANIFTSNTGNTNLLTGTTGTINIGSATGFLDINCQYLYSSFSGTQILYHNGTVINFANIATSLSIGTSATSGQTITIGTSSQTNTITLNATTLALPNCTALTCGTGLANLFTTTTQAVNFLSNASYINFGSSTTYCVLGASSYTNAATANLYCNGSTSTLNLASICSTISIGVSSASNQTFTIGTGAQTNTFTINSSSMTIGTNTAATTCNILNPLITLGSNATSTVGTSFTEFTAATNFTTFTGAITLPVPLSTGETNPYYTMSISRCGIQLTSNTQAMTTSGGGTITGTWTYRAMKIGPMVILTLGTGAFTTSSPGTQVYEAIFTFPTSLLPHPGCQANNYLIVCRANNLIQDCRGYVTNSGAQINFECATSGVYGQFWAASNNQILNATIIYNTYGSSSL